MVTIQVVMTTFKGNKQHPRKQNQKGSRRHIKHERHCIRVSEAHAFYPRRILTAAAVHGASREHGRERLLALFSSSNRKLSPVRSVGGGGARRWRRLRALLLRWRWFFSSALSQAKNPRYITSAFSKCCPLLLQAMPPPRAS